MNNLRSEIDAVGIKLQALLAEDEDAVLVAVGAIQSNPDCELKSCVATITATVDGKSEQFSGNGVALLDSLYIARGKLRQRRENVASAKAKAKAGAA